MPPIREAFASLWRASVVRVAAVVGFAGALLAFLYYTRGVWLLFLLALLVAYLAQPLMNGCERRLRARWLGLFIFMLGFFLLAGLVSVVIAGVAEQVAQFSRQLPGLIERAAAASQVLPERIGTLPVPAALERVIEQAYRNLGGFLGNLVGGLVSGLERFVAGGGLLGRVGTFVTDVVRFAAFLVMTLYLLLDFPKVSRSLLAAVPVPYQATAEDVTAKLGHAFGGYFRGQLVVALAVGLAVWLGLWRLGVPLALSLGFLAAVLNLVPYLGPAAALVPSLLLAAEFGLPRMAGVVAVFALVNQLEAHLLSPLILGRTTRLHPVTVVLAVLTGAVLSGLWGAVFAVPVAAFLKLVYEDYYLPSRLHGAG